MKQILVIASCLLVVFSSCSVYKNSQTPDDVYYSSGTKKESAVSANNNQDQYYSTAASDQYVQLKAQDPARWSYFDDYAYGSYPAYGYGATTSFAFGFGSPWIGFGYYDPFSYWNSYYIWNSYYNPYYNNVIIVGGKMPSSTTAYTQLRPFVAGAYTGSRTFNVQNSAHGSAFTPYTPPSNRIGTNGYNNGNSLRRLFGTDNNYNNGINHQSTRTYSPSSFGSGSAGHSSGGGSFGRPGRG